VTSQAQGGVTSQAQGSVTSQAPGSGVTSSAHATGTPTSHGVQTTGGQAASEPSTVHGAACKIRSNPISLALLLLLALRLAVSERPDLHHDVITH